MRRFLTAAFLVAIVGTGGACASTDDTATPGASAGASAGTSSAAAPSASATAAAGNTKEICAAAVTLVNEADINAFGRNLGALAAARQMKNAEAETTAKNAIKTQAGLWAKQLGDLGQRADDPALRTTLGTFATALTAVATDEALAGVKSVEDAGAVVAKLSPSIDALTKACK